MQSVWMLLASLLFAVMAACVKLGSPEVGSLSMVFWRGLFGVLIMGGWAMICGRNLNTPYVLSHLKRSGLGTVALALWLFSVTVLPLPTGMTLNYTSPLFMAAFLTTGALVRGRLVEWGLVAATCVGFVGVVIVLQPEFQSGQEIAGFCGLLSGMLSALAYFQIRELTELHEPEWRVVFYFSVFNLVFGLVTHGLFEPSDVYTMKSVSCIVGAGVSATLAQICMTKAFGSGNLLLSSILSFSGIVFATFIGLFIFGDPISLQSASGIVIIILAGVTASVMTKRRKTKSIS